MNPESTKAVPLTCHGHSRPVTHLSFSDIDNDNQYYLMSACKDNNPMLRDGVTGDWIGTFIGHKGACWQARLSVDATLACTASADFSARVWDTYTGECLHILQHPHIVRAVAFPPQSRPEILATGGFDKKLVIYELGRSSFSTISGVSPLSPNLRPQSRKTDIQPVNGYEIGAGVHQGAIKNVTWGPDPNMLITACEDKFVRWFDIRSQQMIAKHELKGRVGSCELNPSMSTLAVAAGKSVSFFSGSVPGQLLQSYVFDKEIASVAVHEAARKFVTGGDGDTWVRVWNLDSDVSPGSHPKEIDIWKGHHGPVWSLGFSPDGNICASGSEDGTIKLWKFCEGSYGLWK